MKIGHLAAGVVILGGAAAAGAVLLRDKASLTRARLGKKAAISALEAGDVAAATSAYGDMWERAGRVGRLTGQGAQADALSAEARNAILDLEQLGGPLEQRLSGLDAEGKLQGVDYAGLAELKAELWVASAQSALRAESPTSAQALLEKAQAAGASDAQLAPLRQELASRQALADAEQAARDGKFAEAVRLLEGAKLEGLELPDALALRERIEGLEAVAGDTAALEAFRGALDAFAKRVPDELGELLEEVQALEVPTLRGGHEQAREQASSLEAQVARRARLIELATQFAGMVYVRRVGDKALFVDRHEVTNAEFARFVENGGYSKDSHWSAKGLELRERCVDRAGKPGPKNWEAGPPEGSERQPVRYVGPYEAEAYANWASKRLPTRTEWTLAADGRWRGEFSQGMGNVRDADQGQPVDVGTLDQSAGARDLCGNVAEIVRKDVTSFLAIGGSYRKPWSASAPAQATPLPPTLRASDVGFRCARDLELPWE